MGEFSRGYGHATTKLPALLLATIEVVFGDIGTSPLYALKESFVGPTHHVTQASVFGVLSLIFWTIVMLVSIKYVLIVMRADNQGEGGSLALLARSQRAGRAARGAGITLLGVFAAALFYGDGMITPAISVLCAVEGLK